MHEAAVVVGTDPKGIRADFPDGDACSIAWDDVECVAIETNDSGPWGADFWWRFEGIDGCCTYPEGATGEKEVIELLSERFPGFGFDQLSEALGSTTNARFVCWQRTERSNRPQQPTALRAAAERHSRWPDLDNR